MNIQELKNTKIVKKDDYILPLTSVYIGVGVTFLINNVKKEINSSGNNKFLHVDLSHKDFFVPIPLYRGRIMSLKKSISDIIFD